MVNIHCKTVARRCRAEMVAHMFYSRASRIQDQNVQPSFLEMERAGNLEMQKTTESKGRRCASMNAVLRCRGSG